MGKGGRCVGLTSVAPSYVGCLEILEASTSSTLISLRRPVQAKLHLYHLENGARSAISSVRHDSPISCHAMYFSILFAHVISLVFPDVCHNVNDVTSVN